MSEAQAAFGDGFGVNVTKLSSDIILAIHNELHTVKFPSACEFLRDDIRARDTKLDKSIAALHNHNYILQRENRDLHDMLATLLSATRDTQMMLPNFTDTKALPPILRVGNTNFTYSLVGPEGTLAHLLAARYLMNHSSQSPIRGPDNPNTTASESNDTRIAGSAAGAAGVVAAGGSGSPKHSPEDDWREPVLFFTMLTVVILYILFLLCIYIKKTADAQLRQQPRKANTNASLEFWKRHREEEREKKAREELREAREKMAVSSPGEQRRTGVEGIRGFMAT